MSEDERLGWVEVGTAGPGYFIHISEATEMTLSDSIIVAVSRIEVLIYLAVSLCLNST